MDDWLSSLHIAVEAYFGGHTLEGNGCNRVLKSLDKLATILPEELSDYPTLMRAFKGVADACFSSKQLLPDYGAKIAAFADAAYLVKQKHEMTISPKQHIIIEHVEPFIDKFKAPLGRFSEHELESAHYAFDKIWQRTKVNDYKNPQFGKSLLKAVLTFNANNMK